jgi:hypothetical protein
MARHAKTIDQLRVVDLLQVHITPALCQAVFGAVQRTERRRVWTLEALIRLWTAVVLRAPKALSQALDDALESRDPTYPRINAGGMEGSSQRSGRLSRSALRGNVAPRGPVPSTRHRSGGHELTVSMARDSIPALSEVM